MNRYIANTLAALTKVWDHARGERRTRLLEVNDSLHESYRLAISNGGEIALYCTETIHELAFAKWWVPNRRYYTYSVYGHCDPLVPAEFADRIRAGFAIGRMLPRTAMRRDQKRAAIHAFISLIVAELGQKNE